MIFLKNSQHRLPISVGYHSCCITTLYSYRDQLFGCVVLQFYIPAARILDDNEVSITDIINQPIAFSNLEEGFDFDESRYELRLNRIMN